MLTLLGVVPQTPRFTYDSNGVAAYTATTDAFDINATPLTFRTSLASPTRPVTNPAPGDPRTFDIHVLIDDSGNLIGGTAGDDLVVYGNVDLDNNPLTLADNYSGILLTGEVLDFGFLNVGATDQYDFRFAPTGGALVSFFAGKDIGVTVTSEHSSFVDDFEVDFTGGAKGDIGVIDRVPGRIVVEKITDPVGDLTSFSFSTTGAGYSSFGLADADSPTDQLLAPGTYTVAELVPAGWSLSNLTIVDPTGDSTSLGATATLELAPGETIHVTFTDTKLGRIVVDKVTDPAGDPTSFGFSTTGAGYSSFGLADADAPNDQELAPGIYTVAELVSAGWDLASIVVVDPTGNSTTLGNTATLDLAAGETIHVTYNDTKRGRIVVDKITNPSGDATSFSFRTTGAGYSNFGLADADAPNDQELAPGTYTVAELVPAGWTLASIAIVDPSGNSTSLGDTATIELAAGETVTVTYTDTKLGRIIVDKVTNPAGDATSFSFSTTGSGYASFGLTDAAAPNDQLLLPGTYTVAELVPAGWTLASIAIVDPTGNSTSLGDTATIELAAGETVTVTYTDTKLGRIIVDKVTTPAGDATSFSTTGAGYAGFNLTDAAAPNNQELAPGTYTVAELVPSGWNLTGITIVDPTGNSTSLGNTATLNLAAGETIHVTYADQKLSGSISGTKYKDLTGNGLTGDDTPMAGVKVYLDTNNNGSWNSGEPFMVTAANGTYSFTNLTAGTYNVREVVPGDYVRTAPTLTDKYTINLPAGGNSTGNNFANASKQDCLCDLSDVVYIINGTTYVTDLRGNTNEGDTVQVSFTIDAGAQPQRLTLVSYTAPGASFVAADAYLQQIFDIDTGIFGPGTHTLQVTNPHSFCQVDFVCGDAIDVFGPAGSNIFYSAQNRLISADNDGTHAVLATGSSISGTVYHDANNNGQIEIYERTVAGAKIKLTGTSTTGQSISQSALTDIDGFYKFDNLPAGTYTITETQPEGYTDGIDTIGSLGGNVQADKFTGIVLAADTIGENYNFGEKQVVGTAVAGNQTATTAYWNNSNGQALIKALNDGQNDKDLGNWLASNFSNMYGANAGSSNLAGKTNAQVAAFYKSLYSNTARKVEVQAMAIALAVYVTKSSLAGNTAVAYGFAVSANGLGAATVNVGDDGAAFGVDNYDILTVLDLLTRTNARAKNGLLWDANANGSFSTAESLLRSQALSLFTNINNT